MAKLQSPTSISFPDFVLGIFEDGEVERFSRDGLTQTRSTAFGYDGSPVVFFSCCPADGIMREVTADLALDWWNADGSTFGAVPEAFADHLVDQIEAAQPVDGRAQYADARRADRVGA